MKKAIITLVCCFILTYTFGQAQKKASTNLYRQIARLDTNEIRSGKHLDLAQEYTIEQFVAYYVEKGKTRFTKKYGTETIELLYSDAVFSYFGRKYLYGLIDFFKVEVSDLEKINLENIKGKDIRNYFINHIVPASDKKKVTKNEKSCMSTNHLPQFIYEYKKEANEILITYKWGISCEFLFNIINKTYVALYDIKTKTFKIIE